MEKEEIVSSKMYNLINKVANGKIENYTVTLRDSNKKGDGLLGEICYLTLKNKNNGDVINLVIKQAFSIDKLRAIYPIRKYFVNEINFYSKVWKCFNKFQVDSSLSDPFDKIPNFFGSSLEFNHEKLALENIRYHSFQMYDKTKPLDDEHFKFIFKQYGRFHALSFAYKYLHPQEYHEVTKDLEDLYGHVAEVKPFANVHVYAYELALESLQNLEDVKVIERYKIFLKNGIETFRDKTNYRGHYSVVLHGDCWSNNIMFKYDEEKKLCDMRLLDFQFAKVGTPVSDLSYILYSSGSKETFDKLDHYLEVYHESLSATLEEFKLNSGNIFPMEELKKDWKKYCQMGFAMSLFVCRLKLICDGVRDLTDMEDDIDFSVGVKNTKYDQETFKLRTRELIVHMVENDFI